jgi:hypothetical protein
VNLLDERFYQEIRSPMAKCSPIPPDFVTTDSLFVEIRLTGDDDPDYPEVTLVGAHPQRK